MFSRSRFILLAVVSLMLALLTPVMAQIAPANLIDGCATAYDPDVDYFPDKVEVDYAQGFAVEYFNNYKLVTILTPWQGADETFQYVLVQCGTPAPEGFFASQVFEVPVNSFIAMSTSFLPHLDSQGVVDRLVGLDSFLYTSTPSVLERIEAGDIVEVGSFEPNVEILLDLEPDLIMAQQFSAGPGAYTVLGEVGLPVVLNADFVDTSPLGQAEWGKYIALFFNTEAAANAVFNGVAQRYESLAQQANDADARPTVFAASPYDGIWYMPGGQSYVARLLADAGADYLWAAYEGMGSLFLDFEVVLDIATDADFWVNLNQFWTTLDEALAADPRYGEFAAVRNGAVYNNNARMNPNFGNDYFESGVANPDLLLADLVAIFHPELLPDHEFVYYLRLLPAE